MGKVKEVRESTYFSSKRDKKAYAGDYTCENKNHEQNLRSVIHDVFSETVVRSIRQIEWKLIFDLVLYK